MSEWYYLLGTEQNGPVAEATLKESFSTQQLAEDTLVWTEGMEAWTPAAHVPIFFAIPEPSKTVAPPPIETAAPAHLFAAKVAEGALFCAHCKQSFEIIPDYPTPLCGPCRTGLVNFPVPKWIKMTVGVLAVLMLISAVRMPWELGATFDYEWGQMAEQKGDYKDAALNYQNALQSYPKSVDILCGLARSAHRAGDQQTALDCVNRLIARAGPEGDVSKQTLDVINEVRGNKP